MKQLIEQIKIKVDCLDDRTKESRARKGAYVDCLCMAKEADKNLSSNKRQDLYLFFLWFRENGEKYVDKSIENMIEIYEKENNVII